MKIRQGKIGRQESAALVGMAVYTAMVFTMDTQLAYSRGNSTYIWMPLSIGLSLGATLLIMRAMERRETATLDALLKSSFGTVLGGAACMPIIGLLIINAFFVIADFVNMVHSFVFYNSGYWEVTAWILFTVFFLSFMGLECVSRTALIVLPAFLLIMAITIINPMRSFQLYRLYPFPGNAISEIGGLTLGNTIRPFGAMLSLLAITDGVHGIRFARSSCVAGSLSAAALVLFTQLAMGLTYTYIDLADMYYPLYRLDKMLVDEGYFFRLDNLLLFFWLSAGIISAAYYVYTASALWCRTYCLKDTRPAVVAICILAGCGALIQAENYYDEFRVIYAKVGGWGWTVIGVPTTAAIVQLMKKKPNRKAGA